MGDSRKDYLSEVLNRACSLAAFKDNVRSEYRSGKTAQGTQHVAIAMNVLKKSCGVNTDERLSAKEIVSRGQSKTESSEGFVPPESVRKNAAKGLELRKKFGRGGLSRKQASKQGIGSGVQRATNLKNGDRVSLETIKRMHSYFSRHQGDSSADGWGSESNPSAGWIAWLLWGGDAGWEWAKSILKKTEELALNPGAKGRSPFRFRPYDRFGDVPVHRKNKSGREKPFIDPEDFTVTASGSVKSGKKKKKKEESRFQTLVAWMKEKTS